MSNSALDHDDEFESGIRLIKSAYNSKIHRFEDEISNLKTIILNKDNSIDTLEHKLTLKEDEISDSNARIKSLIDEQNKLLNDNVEAAEMIRKLKSELFKLNSFKKAIFETLHTESEYDHIAANSSSTLASSSISNSQNQTSSISDSLFSQSTALETRLLQSQQSSQLDQWMAERAQKIAKEDRQREEELHKHSKATAAVKLDFTTSTNPTSSSSSSSSSYSLTKNNYSDQVTSDAETLIAQINSSISKSQKYTSSIRTPTKPMSLATSSPISSNSQSQTRASAPVATSTPSKFKEALSNSQAFFQEARTKLDSTQFQKLLSLLRDGRDAPSRETVLSEARSLFQQASQPGLMDSFSKLIPPNTSKK